MLLRDVIRQGKQVHTCSPEDNLQEVVNKLVKYNIGSLVVMDGQKMVGIITERDILKTLATHDGQFGSQLVRDCMTRELKTVIIDIELTEVMGLMTQHRIRHLPILAEGELAGIVSIGDIVKAQHDELSQENHYLKSYIQS
jgi:CBS domain-containing protein